MDIPPFTSKKEFTHTHPIVQVDRNIIFTCEDKLSAVSPDNFL